MLTNSLRQATRSPRYASSARTAVGRRLAWRAARLRAGPSAMTEIPDNMTSPMRIPPILMQLLLGTSLLAQPSPTERLQNLLSDLLIIDTHIDTAGYIRR